MDRAEIEAAGIANDVSLARRYLHELAAACAEGSTSADPRVTKLALAVVARAGQEAAA